MFKIIAIVFRNMLELRPTCEHCNKPLPYNSTEAMICTFECTFCEECVSELLMNVCPNCGGGFVSRPIRPKSYLEKYPPGTVPVYKPFDLVTHAVRIQNLSNIHPKDR
ncbi:MAG: DUF1272 domain-containing protein [Ferruginibacter sp.]